jgi:hypothetical protein
MELGHVMALTLGSAIILGTAWLYVAARRKSLIQPSTMYLAAISWVGASVLAIYTLLHGPSTPPAACVPLLGVLALAVLPLAAAPLALSWNRHR